MALVSFFDLIEQFVLDILADILVVGDVRLDWCFLNFVVIQDSL